MRWTARYALGNLDHPLDLIGVCDQEHEIVLVGAVFLQAPLVLEEFENQVGGRAGLGRLHAGGVVMDDGQFRGGGVIVQVHRLGREEVGRENPRLPHFTNAVVEFRFRLDLAHQPHLVIDDLAQRRLGLEAVTHPVVVEEPATV